MTETPRSRSGLDIPEGSANADTVSETKLIDTNADDARNEHDANAQNTTMPVDQTGGVDLGGVQGQTSEQEGTDVTSSSPGVSAPPPDGSDSPGTTTEPGQGTPAEGDTPASNPVSDQPTQTPSDSPDQTGQPGEVQPDGSTETPAQQ